jgi:hypothetical protein
MPSISERAVAARRQTRTRQQPQYVARARVANGWINIGAAWPLRTGEDGFSVNITSMPLGWEGRFVLIPPLPDDQLAAAPDEDAPM